MWKLLISCLLLFVSFGLQAQPPAWIAPDSADALVNPYPDDEQAALLGKATFEAALFYGKEGLVTIVTLSWL